MISHPSIMEQAVWMTKTKQIQLSPSDTIDSLLHFTWCSTQMLLGVWRCRTTRKGKKNNFSLDFWKVTAALSESNTLALTAQRSRFTRGFAFVSWCEFTDAAVGAVSAGWGGLRGLRKRNVADVAVALRSLTTLVPFWVVALERNVCMWWPHSALINQLDELDNIVKVVGFVTVRFWLSACKLHSRPGKCGQFI